MIPSRQQIKGKQSGSQLTKADKVIVRWAMFSQPAISPVPLVFGHAASNRLFEWAGQSDSRLKRVVRIIRQRALAYRKAGYRQDAPEKACHDLLGCISDFI